MSAAKQEEVLTHRSVMNDRHGKHFATLVSVMVITRLSTEMLSVLDLGEEMRQEHGCMQDTGIHAVGMA